MAIKKDKEGKPVKKAPKKKAAPAKKAPKKAAKVKAAPKAPKAPTEKPVLNREAWLHAAADFMAAKIFGPNNYEVPSIEISCGFTGSRSKKAIGVCWSKSASDNDAFPIFISPVIEENVRVMGVLAHEMCHAVVGLEAGHGAPFKKAAIAIGLTGKMTATTETATFATACKPFIKQFGDFPHAKMNVGQSGVKKQTTRMIKLQCPACKFTMRCARSWVDNIGEPICACDGETLFMEA